MSEQTFTVHLEADIDMTVDEIWPDGNAPKNPTADDVVEAMERDELGNFTNKMRVLRDWCLLEDLDVSVSGPGLDEDLTCVKAWDYRRGR